MSDTDPPGVSIEENSTCPRYEFSQREKVIADLLNRSENVIQRLTTSLHGGSLNARRKPPPGAPRVHLHASVASTPTGYNKHLPNESIWDQRQNYIFTQDYPFERRGKSVAKNTSLAGKIVRETQNSAKRKNLTGKRRGNWFFMPSETLFPLRQSHPPKTKVVMGKVLLDECWGDILSGKQQRDSELLQPVESKQKATQTENQCVVEILAIETESEDSQRMNEISIGQLNVPAEAEEQDVYETDFERDTSSNKNSNSPADASSGTQTSVNMSKNEFIALSPVLVAATPGGVVYEKEPIKAIMSVACEAKLPTPCLINPKSDTESSISEPPTAATETEEDHVNEIFEEMLKTVNSRKIPQRDVDFSEIFHPVIDEKNNLMQNLTTNTTQENVAEECSTKWKEANQLLQQRSEADKLCPKLGNPQGGSCVGCNHQIEINYSTCRLCENFKKSHDMKRYWRKFDEENLSKATRKTRSTFEQFQNFQKVRSGKQTHQRKTKEVNTEYVQENVENFISDVRESLLSLERDSLPSEMSSSQGAVSDPMENLSEGEILSEGEVQSYSSKTFSDHDSEGSSS